MLYVLFVVGLTVTPGLVLFARLPVAKSVESQRVALLFEVQVSVVGCPELMVLGLAVRDTVGSGSGITQ